MINLGASRLPNKENIKRKMRQVLERLTRQRLMKHSGGISGQADWPEWMDRACYGANK